MRLPVQTTDDDRVFALRPRQPGLWREMALATQANLVLFRDIQCGRGGIPIEQHEIKTPPPPATPQPGERLLSIEAAAGLSDNELTLRCRQLWGEFSALCWLFEHDDPGRPPDFTLLPDSAARCPAAIALKLEEVRHTLWRLRFEQNLRFTLNFRLRPDFHDLKIAAGKIPVTVYDHPVHTAPAAALLLYSCEMAGILAALRWALDDRWTWEQDGITHVGMEF